jgi:DHA1 family inner membrane transport protein
VLWGFAFWMAVPGVFGALADRSANPADRAGDAQAVMAGGRVIGPLVGGVILDVVGTPWLGVVGGGLIIAAGLVVLTVCLRSPVRSTRRTAGASI